MLVDLSERGFDKQQFQRVCEMIFTALVPNQRNAMRFVGKVAIQLGSMQPEYQ